MKMFFKVSGIAIGVILALSITVKGKTLFSYIYGAISPATIFVQNKTEDLFNYSYKTAEGYTKKIFDNSVPKMKDSVKSRLSAHSRAAKPGEPEETIRIEEKEELDSLIKNHRKQERLL